MRHPFIGFRFRAREAESRSTSKINNFLFVATGAL